MSDLADVHIEAAGHQIHVKERPGGVSILLDGEYLYDTDFPKPSEEPRNLQEELTRLLNKHSAENLSNTPDFVLARYLMLVLEAHTWATKRRDEWYDVALSPGQRTIGRNYLKPDDDDGEA